MNLDEYMSTLINGCLRHSIDRANVIISHGGASLIFGFRDTTSDIDVSIPMEDYVRLSRTMEVTKIPARDGLAAVEFISDGVIDWHPASLDDQNKDTFILDGFKVTTKPQLLKDRLALYREKDMSDIHKLIQDFIEEPLTLTKGESP